MSTKDAADCGYWGFSFPSKMVAALVRALCGGAADEGRIAAARLCADWLISISEGPDRPLAYFPPTYHSGDPAKAQGVVKEYWGQVMLIYPAEFGRALLKLYAVTEDKKYLAQAKGIAETYLRLQGEDGTWFLKMDTKTGKAVKPNRLMPIASAMPFLNALHAVTGDGRYLVAADRAFSYVENGPMKTWNWEGQFEDVGPDGAYRNLTKHDACSTAIYICERYPEDKTRLAVARDILRFAEDQFVCWEKPFPDYPFSHDTQNVANWVLPGVMEQYYWYVPIDASASKLIRTYLALYRVERNPLDLAKARALGDAMTRMQKTDGDIPTHWHGDESGCSWWNCLLSDVYAMNELATMGAADRPAGASAGRWPGFERGIGMGGWFTNYKRFNVLRNDWRMKLPEGDFEHFETFITERDDRHKVLWAGEFGTIRHADAKSRVAWMRDMVSICREGGFPYCVWNYLSTPNDGNRFSLVDDDTREFLSRDLLNACLGGRTDR